MGQKIDLARFRSDLGAAGIVALDSMIFIYLLEDVEEYREIVGEAFSLIEDGKITAVTSIISLVEALSPSKLISELDRQQDIERYFKEEKKLRVVEVNWEIARLAATIRREVRIGTPDALQIATGKVLGAKLFITNDERLKKTSVNKKVLKICLLSDYVTS